MTKVHHLNFGTMRAIPVDPNSVTSCHCLLLEDKNGLVLIDTGLGLIEMQHPKDRFGEQLLNVWGFTIDEKLTAIQQLKKLGFNPSDVKHIVLSHVDVDHAGGLRDFPNATVHLASEELANLEAKNPRYLFNQFEQGPKWQPHPKSDEKWFGLEARDLPLGLESTVKLIPLFGHTHGHCGIAVQQGEKWLLHAADTYYRRVEFLTDANAVTALSSHTADDNAQRIASIAALRKLAEEQPDQVTFFSTHDVLELPDSVVKKVLIVTTSHDRFVAHGHDAPTGVWLEEFAVPFMELFKAGVALTVASPKGGAMPVDPRSAATLEQESAWQPAIISAKNTRRLSEMNASDFDAIFIPGGHGPMFDLPENADLIRLLGDFEKSNKVIASVCHGPAGLLNAKRADGQALVSGKRVTSYTAAEEVAAKLDQAVPFMLETELRNRGANFIPGDLKADHVERDGNLITGQNPASSASVARELVGAICVNV
jgi:putative intracellular protease/amidase/ribonuclease BN (tRNA processing enzyme)